jgi:hypothetical protein
VSVADNPPAVSGCYPKPGWIDGAETEVETCGIYYFVDADAAPLPDLPRAWVVAPQGGSLRNTDLFWKASKYDLVYEERPQGDPCGYVGLVPAAGADPARLEVVPAERTTLVAQVDVGSGLVPLRDGRVIREALAAGLVTEVFTGLSVATCEVDNG